MPTQINASVKMPPALRDRLRGLAEARRRTPHSLMLQAIEDYVEREEKRETLRREALAAHEHYVRTGLHLSNSEVVEWMDKIIQGEKADLPQCHT